VTATLSPVFAALGDETRWQILVRLAERPSSASRLAPEFPISRQAIMKHLEVLRAVGLVEVEPRGREMVYIPVGARLSRLAGELERIGRAWDARLLQIKALAEKPPPSA
jgi:predicted transcriptional regulator